MTRYEDMIRKADLMAETAYRCARNGALFMVTVWMMKSRQIREKAANLRIDRAMEEV